MRNPIQIRIYNLLAHFNLRKLARFWSIVVGFDAPLKLPPGLILPHPYAVVIHSDATIGEGCVIYQSVTVGADIVGQVPIIGDRATIYAGTVIVGKVHIGNDCIIGANSFVNIDVPDNSIAFGNPARVISTS
jgi:serine O-acetyltransferase